MYKFFTVALFCLSFFFTNAQIPPGYYNNAYIGAVPKTCATLKTALYNIISTGTNELPYTNSSTFDTWDAINSIDTQRNDANTAYIMWDMYTDNPTGAELYTFTPVVNKCGSYTAIGDCYNREHSFPQAWFGSVTPMLTDMHHIFATDGFTNGKHDNFPYADVKPSAITWQSPSGAKLGTSNFTGYNGRVFEVIDAYKGDFARAMFYMVTRYENFVGGGMSGWQGNSNADSVLNGTTWPAFDNWAIKQWYKWHIQDPVSQKEIIRNNKVYGFQNNRNPFIDHPEFVELIWQCTGLLPVILTDFNAVKNNNAVDLKWSITRELNFKQYEIERSIDGTNFSKIATIPGRQLSNYTLTDQNLPDAKIIYYRLKMVDIDAVFTYSNIVPVRINPKNGGISIYPNPAVNEMTVLLQHLLPANSQLKITDISGKEIFRKNITVATNNIKINTQNYPSGRYFITVISKDNLLHDSFVIIQ